MIDNAKNILLPSSRTTAWKNQSTPAILGYFYIFFFCPPEYKFLLRGWLALDWNLWMKRNLMVSQLIEGISSSSFTEPIFPCLMMQNSVVLTRYLCNHWADSKIIFEGHFALSASKSMTNLYSRWVSLSIFTSISAFNLLILTWLIDHVISEVYELAKMKLQHLNA